MLFTLEDAVYAVLIAFGASVILCPTFIPFLHRLKFGQPIRDDGPQTHLKKAGTPTMGGIVIVLSFLIGSIFFIRGNNDGIAIVLVTIGFGIIGFIDDYIKVIRKNPKGLKSSYKMIGLIIVSAAFAWYLYAVSGLGTEIYIPFTNNFYLDLGIWYWPLYFLAILGTTNGSNFTDGLDGLNSGVTVLIATFFLFIAFGEGSPLLPVTGAVVGSLLGFLLFNSYPAKVIMGDTGSLALGGFIAALAIMLRMPLMILIVGIIYLAEVVSVMLQVNYFKLTKGKRLFKMAPIHHHFEMIGWSETRVVSFFYIITAIVCLIGYLAAPGV